jgi:hypothetical protein
MEEKTIKNLEQLEQMFQHTCQVCDPLDYQIRQRNFLYTLANYLLLPLMEHREELKKKAAENSSNLPTTDKSSTPIETINAK